MAADRHRDEREATPTVPPRPQRRNPWRLREVLLAASLTAAAVGFIAAAMLRGDGSMLRHPNLEAERKPFSELSH